MRSRILLGALRNFVQKTEEPQGQILATSRLGRWIQLVASEPGVESIVEIGTWKGLGSTLLVSNSIRESGESTVFYSLEANKVFHEIAQRNLHRERNVQLIWGTIVSPEDLDRTDLEEHEVPWLLEDEKCLVEAPNVLHLLPNRIDLLILDGGEFSTWSEFLALEARLARYLVLDDTKVRKCRRVETYLSSSNRWVQISMGTDRNGWSVWMKSS